MGPGFVAWRIWLSDKQNFAFGGLVKMLLLIAGSSITASRPSSSANKTA
jgi:hypothetical protein